MRPGRPEDAFAVASVQAAAWAERYAVTMPGDVLPNAAHLEPAWSQLMSASTPQGARVLVAYVDSTVVGVLSDSPATDPDLPPTDWREITELAIDPAHANSGHGSRLLAAWADGARQAGHAGAVLWVCADDDALRSLATSAGFAADGAHRTLDLYGDGAITVRMVRLTAAL